MKYVAIDIETTGLDPRTCSILSFAAVFDPGSGDIDSLPIFEALIKPESSTLRGEPIGLAMNAELLKQIGKGSGSKLERVIYDFAAWVRQFFGPDRVTFAGKNVGAFDIQFLKHHVPESWSEIKQYHRYLDPGSMFVRPDDKCVPDLLTCLQRAGYTDRTTVAHTALEDCKDVIRCVRSYFNSVS